MRIDWDSVNTFDEWANTLAQLLEAAADGIQSGDVQKRVAIQKALSEFIKQSPNVIASELDEIARKAISDIFHNAVDEALGNIASRSAELSRHTQVIQAVTKNAEADVKTIRLEKATSAINSASAIIRDLRDLKTAIEKTVGVETAGMPDRFAFGIAVGIIRRGDCSERKSIEGIGRVHVKIAEVSVTVR